ncbi:MAG TPA: hypothetical protein VM674_01880 [Candidatus Acidoferrum sp.]|nr:hypothetical protein [Candidatus Acidoferrum sp.]
MSLEGRRANFAICASAALLGWVTSAIPAAAAFPGVNGRISFASNQTGSSQIYTMNSDGSDVVQLTSAPGNSVISDWSPDGQRIAFDSDRTGSVEVFSMRSDGSDVRQLTHLGEFTADPSWSPDGTQLVFENFPGPGLCCTNLWTINADGTGLRQLTNFSANTFPGEPEFSPDGESIAFQQFPNGAGPGHHAAIFVMKADGTHLRQVTDLALDAGHPEWSPDGSRIIFNNDFTGMVGDIFTIRPNGTQLTRLTDVIPLGEADFRPDYSPDGTKIVFNQFIPGQPLRILVMNADGLGAHDIDTSNAFAPDWGPQLESNDE